MTQKPCSGIAWSAYQSAETKDFVAFRGAFHEADGFLRFMADRYGLTTPVPEIKIFAGNKLEACAAPDNHIYLSSGVVTYALQVFEEMFSGDLPAGIERPN